MDDFLRAVVQRRELERVAFMERGDPTARLRCLGCGVVLVEEAVQLRCSKCGPKGARRKEAPAEWDDFHEQRRLMLEDVAATVNKNLEEAMADKKCSKCGRRLRSDNEKGKCGDAKRCAAAVGAPLAAVELLPSEPTAIVVAEDKPIQHRRRRTDDANATTLERFRMLAEALDFDPEQVLAEFAKGWLERAAFAVRNPPPRNAVEAIMNMVQP